MFSVLLGAIAASPIRLRRYMWAAAALWTVAIAIVLVWEISDEQQQAIDIARADAVGAWKKDMAIFRWAAATGHIYVPVTENTRPDTHMSALSERDISTPSGKKLTLISPLEVISGVRALDAEQAGLKGHITSLAPVRPRDAPDPWEKEALEALRRAKRRCGARRRLKESTTCGSFAR